MELEYNRNAGNRGRGGNRGREGFNGGGGRNRSHQSGGGHGGNRDYGRRRDGSGFKGEGNRHSGGDRYNRRSNNWNNEGHPFSGERGEHGNFKEAPQIDQQPLIQNSMDFNGGQTNVKKFGKYADDKVQRNDGWWNNRDWDSKRNTNSHVIYPEVHGDIAESNGNPPAPIVNEDKKEETKEENNKPPATKEEPPKPANEAFDGLKIKKEKSPKKDTKKKIIQKEPETSSDSSSESDSDDSEEGKSKKSEKSKSKLSAVDMVKKTLNILQKKEESKTASATGNVKIKKEPADKNQAKKAPESYATSSESESEDSESEAETETNPKKPEDDVVCLGKLEKFENLVDDDESSGSHTRSKRECLLCDKKGHTSFTCQMICRNCGAQYHNLKRCPKPTNLSTMLQTFLEYCLSQCSQYNPEQRFQFQNGLVQNEMLPAQAPDTTASIAMQNAEIFQHKSTKRLRQKSSNHSNSLKDVKVNRRKSEIPTSDSESSCSEESMTSSRRKKKRSKLDESKKTQSMPGFPTNMNFPAGGFPQFAGGMNPTNAAAFNPMLAFSQMMGFNPAAMQQFAVKNK